MKEKVNLKTTDGITIVSNLYRSEADPQKAVVLLHMMPATKESWYELAEKLTSNGFMVIAPDLRGHGESTESGSLDYTKFKANDHQKHRLE